MNLPPFIFHIILSGALLLLIVYDYLKASIFIWGPSPGPLIFLCWTSWILYVILITALLFVIRKLRKTAVLGD